MTFAPSPRQVSDEAIGTLRSALIASSIVGIVLGIMALVWTGPTVLVLAILFGLSMIVAGVFRVYGAFAANMLSGGWRFLLGVLGVLMIIFGVIALFSPADAIWFVAVFIGIGWIFQGVNDLTAAFSRSAHTPTVLLVLSGVISVLAGIVMCSIPGLALTTFVWVAGIMLLVVSVVTLLTLPKKVSA